ncbi:OSCP1 [Symbiodinium sp. KB8]|nr:OSCP1 [Symbiodinium sp. KB8]
MTMPFLIINLGAEMLYILEQRLQAQSIASEKSKKVLIDVVRAMYSPVFLEELFKPQAPYSLADTRAVFDKLAHSSIISIMRLNKTSMDKLYDLMTMGIKQQIMTTSHPRQLLAITLNHLDALQGMVVSPVVSGLLSDAQGKRVKVSLFLQGGMQHLDGSLVLHRAGPVPPGGTPPGSVTYFARDGSRAEQTPLPAVAVPGSLPYAKEVVLDASARTVALGFNMYSADRSKLRGGPPMPGPNGLASRGANYLGAGLGVSASAAAATSLAVLTGQDVQHGAGGAGGAGGGKEDDEEGKAGEGADSASAGLNLLAGLLGVTQEAEDSSPGTFALNLFSASTGEGAGAGGGSGWGSDVLVVDASDAAGLQTLMAQLDDEWGDLGDGKAPEGKEAGDDLLDLMDMA